MPGILPMKVIRVGSNAQSRIAQACDRCRSKKIRCDGIRPQCTQCANVGFECKTSDKLSRRAFPRGYTESLEDRVRALEAEVRELKDLLDEKDEKIDVLSRIHSFSSPSRKCSASLSSAVSEPAHTNVNAAKEGVIEIETLVPRKPSNTTTSQSCTSVLIDAFARKASESKGPQPQVSSDAFKLQARNVPASPRTSNSFSKIPPRLLSDQYINIFFQEWAPLLPIFHRPTFLRVYEQYIAAPDAQKLNTDRQAVAQLFLVFDIAALSSVSRTEHLTASYKSQWREAMHSIYSTVSISALQCHVLAQLFYLLEADYTHGAQHRAVAVSMCHQMGLHHSQNHYVINSLELETRKKVLWCQYALDKFLSASSGCPILLRDCDINTEYPSDVDDENLTEQGCSPTLTGELTKISSAIALFKICRILSRSLTHLLPASASYQFSMSDLNSIADELDRWEKTIPTHLRMKFLNDKPSTGVISDRSPILSLAYFFIRGLIHRPLACHGSGSAASASLLTIADSAKHIVQVLELLDERNMSYVFPVNRADLLLSSGFSLLWQCLELSEDSKLAKDNQRSLKAITNLLRRDSSTIAADFRRIVDAFVSKDTTSACLSQSPRQTGPNYVIDGSAMPAPESKPRSARRQLQAIASRFSSLTKMHEPRVEDVRRRATVPRLASPNASLRHRTFSQLSISSTASLPVFSTDSPPTTRTFMDLPSSSVNLDYLPLGQEPMAVYQTPPLKEAFASPDIYWAKNLEEMDSPNANMCDGLYNGLFQDQISQSRLDLDVSALTNPRDWLDQEWLVSAPDVFVKAPVSSSILSASEGSITSVGEEFSGCGSHKGSTSSDRTELFDLNSRTLGAIAAQKSDQEAVESGGSASRV